MYCSRDVTRVPVFYTLYLWYLHTCDPHYHLMIRSIRYNLSKDVKNIKFPSTALTFAATLNFNLFAERLNLLKTTHPTKNYRDVELFSTLFNPRSLSSSENRKFETISECAVLSYTVA